VKQTGKAAHSDGGTAS